MVKTKRLKHRCLWFHPVTVVEVLCVLSGKRMKLHNKYFGYCFIPYHISLVQQAFCFLKCWLFARKICQMLVLAKINTLLACVQKLTKAILYPSHILTITEGEYKQLLCLMDVGCLKWHWRYHDYWNPAQKFSMFSNGDCCCGMQISNAAMNWALM